MTLPVIGCNSELGNQEEALGIFHAAELLKLFVLAGMKSKPVIFGRLGCVISAVRTPLDLRVNTDSPTAIVYEAYWTPASGFHIWLLQHQQSSIKP